MDREEFYLVSDNDYLVTLFEQEIAFVRNHWMSSGRPTMLVMLTNQMIGNLVGDNTNSLSQRKFTDKWRYSPSTSRSNLLNFMMALRSANVCNGVRVRVGRLSVANL